MIPDGHWRQHLPTSSSSSHPHQTDFIQWVAAPWRTTGHLPSVLCEYYSRFPTSCVTLYLSAFPSRPTLIVRLISRNVSCWLWGFISFQSHDWDVCGQRGLLFSRNISRFDKGLLFSLTPLRQFDTESTVCSFFFVFCFFVWYFFVLTILALRSEQFLSKGGHISILPEVIIVIFFKVFGISRLFFFMLANVFNFLFSSFFPPRYAAQLWDKGNKKSPYESRMLSNKEP